MLQATRSIVITVNNFAGEGLGPLTCAHLRLTDVTAVDANQHKSMGWFRFSSSPGAHKDRPTVVMAKLYKASLSPIRKLSSTIIILNDHFTILVSPT